MKRLFVGLRFSGIITHGLKDLQGGGEWGKLGYG